MELVFRKSESSVEPELLDTTSSATHVYIRKNVEQVEKEGPVEGETYKAFQYDEACLTKQEYALYLVDQAVADATTETQLAIAELAEAVLG